MSRNSYHWDRPASPDSFGGPFEAAPVVISTTRGMIDIAERSWRPAGVDG